ncbi:protein of unknown function [Algoriphagus boritolerans DSM 17298 = JCM 18970]|uniref:3-keto-alpha-glucoside-1,2-lyase/3-keto-2-hydroxy-glucal hydratase domain-containing protein n=2 Tax=Algoriphagus TaxID=246875 RepID=A0A1H5XC97_9BACT|nr:protein of unknown function [Algoriphagus boritolerans DSM 17298 = JCM 18970]
MALIFSAVSVQAQTKLQLSAFENPGGSWSEVAKVWADPMQSDPVLFSEGKGTLILNAPTKKKPGTDIITTEKFGDAEITLVYMMAPGSNSGLYLQGQYEIQLLDSWAKTEVKAGDNGGIYERWDESKPDGQKGYQGYAPRQNASKAPGVWQTLKIQFKAPRFNATGEKIENARIVSVILNGVTIHEDVELFGPTRGALAGGEVAEGPIRIQGDHGPIAIRSLEVKPFDTPAPEFNNISYQVFPGSFTELPAENNLKASSVGKITSFDEFVAGLTSSSLSKFEGTIAVKKAGNYTFRMSVPSNGLGLLQIGNATEALQLRQGMIVAEKSLPAGEVPFVIWVSKPTDWTAQGFYLAAESEAMWPKTYTSPAGMEVWATDPILVDTRETPVLRSFIELPDRSKISHGISVSSQSGTHFSYDLNSNQLLRVWRGGFLDATPMWNNRGNGVSRPLGAVTELSLGTALLLNADRSAMSAEWQAKGYQILGDGAVKFSSQSVDGQSLTDQIQVLADGKGIARKIELSGNSTPMKIRVAPGKVLTAIADDLYWIEDSGLYLKVERADQKPEVGKDGIFLPVTTSLSYNLLF